MGKQLRRFEGKGVAVTGAARGIGRNIARAFGREGARVAICDIDDEKARAAVADFVAQDIRAEFVRVDLGQRGAPQAMVRQIADRWGKLDALINNARSGGRSDPLQEDEDRWEECFSVTLHAAFFASQEAMHVMKASGGGAIVNISSTTALVAARDVSPAYQISKAGMIQMTRYFAAHGGPSKVRVNAVLPGFIVQDEHRNRFEQKDNDHYRHIAEYSQPAKRTGTSDDVANACLFLCSQESAFITGQCLVVDGGSTIQEHFSLLYEFDRKRHAD